MAILRMKTWVALITITLISACSDYPDSDDFKEFDDFKMQDIAGEEINCKEWVSAKIKKKAFDGRKNYTYTDDVLDYLYKDDYQFKQCGTELRDKLNEYCSLRIDSVIEQSISSTGYTVGHKYEVLCSDKISKELKKINFTYHMPTEKNKFITLNENGTMINPNDIEKIDFQKERESLWSVTIHAQNNHHILYYGKSELWTKAQIDFAEMATKSTSN